MSLWDEKNIELKVPCRVNLKTGKNFNIQSVSEELLSFVCTLDEEYLLIHGEKINIETADNNNYRIMDFKKERGIK